MEGQVMREPLFLKAAIMNVRKEDRKPASVSVRINANVSDVVYVTRKNGRAEVSAYIDPETGLFITETGEEDCENPYFSFRMRAVYRAREEIKAFLSELQALDPDEYESRGYKPLQTLNRELCEYLNDRHDFFADLQKQVNNLVSKQVPKVNEYLAFSDDESLEHPVTTRLPYKNPRSVTLTDAQRNMIDAFLSVFFDDYNKFAFSWYMGAALSNLPLYDDMISKLAVLSSSHGGSGKSTLVIGLANALFTPAFREVKDDFDRFFATNNRFGTSKLSVKRLSVYSEAAWNADPAGTDHDMSGLNVSSMKSLVTEGYLSSEAKFSDCVMDKLSGFHLVVTNYPPVVSDVDKAINRRILPIMVRPTSMMEKARALNLVGRQKFDAFLQAHAQEFARYFFEAFFQSPYAFSETDYDYREFVQDIRESQCELDDAAREGREALNALKAEGLVSYLGGLEKAKGWNLKRLVSDIQVVAGGGQAESKGSHMRLDGDTLYVDAAKPFLLRYGTFAPELRKELKAAYGEPALKFGMRMFAIRLA